MQITPAACAEVIAGLVSRKKCSWENAKNQATEWCIKNASGKYKFYIFSDGLHTHTHLTYNNVVGVAPPDTQLRFTWRMWDKPTETVCCRG